MSDVFISHAQSTVALTRQVADALRALGHSVWWDDELPVHQPFSRIIREHLDAAKAIVVIWSADAIDSDYVHGEAEAGRSARKLVQITADGTVPPIPFNQTQYADLTGWHGEVDAPLWRKVVASVGELVSASPAGSDPIADGTTITPRLGDAAPKAPPHRARALGVIAFVALLVVIASVLVWRRESAPATVTQDSSIAVLPFVAMSEEASLRHLGDGLSEQITIEIAKSSALRVASRSSAFAQSGREAVAIAHGLGVSYVLEGSVRPNGADVRATARLVRGQDGVQIWSETYDVAATDAAAWDETAAMVVMNVGSNLALEHKLRRDRTRTTNAEAFEHYAAAARLGAEFDTGGTSIPPFEQILQGVDRAIALDPDFVPAHVLRAWSFRNANGSATCVRKCIDEERRSADRALELRPDDPEALLRLGNIQLIYDLDPAAAEATFRRVSRIDPTTPRLNENLALLAMFRGDARKACDYWARQLEVTPYLPTPHFWYGVALGSLGDLNGIQREFEEALRLTPRGGILHTEFALAHVNSLIARGQTERAKAEFAPLWEQHRYTHPERFGRELGLLGYEREATQLAAELSSKPNPDPFDVYFAYYGLGQYDQALVWLRRVLEARYIPLVHLRLPNLFPPLQEQPGYAELLAYLDSIQRSR